MIRRFKFYNNIIGENVSMVPTEYCVWGYYDGVQIDLYNSLKEINNTPDSNLMHTHTKELKNEIYEIYELTGFRNEPDNFFWEKPEFPYIFLSCLRFKKKSSNLEAIINCFENDGMICYCTLDNSDLIICYRTSSFRYGMNIVKKYNERVQLLEPNNGVNISFSTLIIAQNFLEELYYLVKKTDHTESDQILAALKKKFYFESEEFSVLLRLNVKDFGSLNKFNKKLQMCFPNIKIDRFLLLGNTDAAFFLKKVNSILFLCQFSKYGFLVHSNDIYREAVYNVQSEILIQEGEDL